MIIFIFTTSLLHWYFWKRFFRDTQLHPRWIRRAGWTLVGLTLLIPLTFFLRRNFVKPLDNVIFLALVSWLMSLFFLICLRFTAGVIPVFLNLLAFWISRKPYDPGRRVFLSRALAAGTLSAGIPGLAYGVFEGMEDPDIVQVQVKLERLPASDRGLTIAQLTDLHVTPWTSEGFIRRVVEKTNRLRPDLIVITGDLVDGAVEQILPKIESLGKLQARYGVYFVTGNHEYYVGAGRWIHALEKMGMRVLTNRGEMIAGALYLCGLPDRTAGRMDGVESPDIGRAMAGRPENLPAILLAHQPRDIDMAVDAGVDFQISGHTHGGQIWPFGMLVMAAQPYLSGLHRRRQTQIYVSRGTGVWGPPIRIAAPSEISKIVLV